MRKSLLFAVFTIILSMAGLAQNGKISYQAVVRNSANQLVHDQDLDVTVGIANSETGTAVYTETHAVHSNANGLISLLIGDGTPVAGSNWDAIQWNHAWVTAVVSQGGTELATHHLPLSAVPYALYADQVDPVALANYLTANHYLTEEVQVLSISHDTVFLTGGSWVKLPAGFSGDYNDLTNKPDLDLYATNAHLNDTLNTYFDSTKMKTAIHDTADVLRGEFPVVNNGQVTIAVNRGTVDNPTFQVNQDGTQTVTINIPDEVTVNNGQLTVITPDDTTRFTANQSGNDTVNLTGFVTTAHLNDTLSKYYTQDEVNTKLADTAKYALRTALADTAGAIRTTVNTQVAYLQHNIDTTSSQVRGALVDTAGAIRTTVNNQVAHLQNNIDTTSSQVRGALVDTAGAIRTTVNNQVAHLQNNIDSTSQHVRGALVDTAAAIRADIHDSVLVIKQGDVVLGTFSANQNHNDTITIPTPAEQAQSDWNENSSTDPAYIKNKPNIRDSVNRVVLDSLSAANSAMNRAVDTIARNNIHDTATVIRNTINTQVAQLQHNIDTTSSQVRGALVDTAGAIRTTVNNQVAHLQHNVDTTSSQVRGALVDTAGAIRTTVNTQVAHLQHNIDTTSSQVRGALVDTAGAIRTTVNNQVAHLQNNIDTTSQHVRGALRDTASAIRTTVNTQVAHLQNNIDSTSQHVRGALVDTAAAIRADIHDSVLVIKQGDVVLGTFSANQNHNDTITIPTPAEQAQSDWNESSSTDPAYIRNKPNIRDSVNRVVLDSLYAANSAMNRAVDTIAQNNIHDTATVIRNTINTQVAQLQHNIDTTSSQVRGALRDTASAIRTTVNNQVAHLQNNIDSTSQHVRGALMDTAAAIRADIHDSVLVIKQGDVVLGTFSANQNHNDTITIPTPAEQAQSDWNESSSTDPAYIRNKPNIRDSVNRVVLDSLSAANSAMNRAVDTIARNNIHDTATVIRNTINTQVAQLQHNIDTTSSQVRGALVDTAGAIRTTVNNQVAHLQNNIDSTSQHVRGALVDTAGAIRTTVNTQVAHLQSNIDSTSQHVRGALVDTAGAIRTTVNTQVAHLQNNIDTTSQHVRGALMDTAAAIRADIHDSVLVIKQGDVVLGTFSANQNYNDTINIPTPAEQAQSDWNENSTSAPAYIKNKPNIRDSVNRVVLDSLAAANSAMNRAVDTIAQNNIHDTATVIRNIINTQVTQLQHNIDTTSQHVRGALVDTAGAIRTTVNNQVAHLQNNIDSTSQHVRGALVDTAGAIRTTVNTQVAHLQSNIDSTSQHVRGALVDTAGAIRTTVNTQVAHLQNNIDTTSQHVRGALMDTAAAIRADIHDSVLVIKQGDVVLGTFSANQNHNDTITIPTPAEQAQSDWNENSSTDPAYIKNKPNIRDSVNRVVLDSLSAANSAMNRAVDTIVQNNIHDTATVIRNTINTQVTQLQHNIDTTSQHVRSALVDTAGAIRTTVNTQVAHLQNNIDSTSSQVRGALVDTASAIRTTVNTQVAHLQNNIDSTSQHVRGALMDTAAAIRADIHDSVLVIKQGNVVLGTFSANQNHNDTITIPTPAEQVQSDWNESSSTDPAYIRNKPNIRDSVNRVVLDSLSAANSAMNRAVDTIARNNIHDTATVIRNTINTQVAQLQHNIDTTSSQVRGALVDTAGAIRTTVNNQVTHLQNNIDTTSQHVRGALRDTARNIRADICDSATLCMERALANPNSAINHAIDTIALNSVKDTLDKYVLKTAVRDSITDNLNLTVKHDSLFLTHGNDIDTVPAGKMIHDSIASRVHDGKLTLIKTAGDTTKLFTANQATNDTLDLSGFYDTTHVKKAIHDSLTQNVELTIKSDSIFLKSGGDIDTVKLPAVPEQVKSDWSETDASSAAYILHKPVIKDSVNIVVKDSLRAANSAINRAIDTIALNSVKDTLDKYVLKTAVRDSITDNVNLTVKHDSLFLTHGNDIDTVPAGKMIHDSIASRVHDGKLTLIKTAGDTTKLFTANQSGNDTLDLSGYYDTVHVKKAIHDSLTQNVELTIKSDSIFLKSGGDIDTVKLPAVPEQVKSDWSEPDASSAAYILHKPVIKDSVNIVVKDSLRAANSAINRAIDTIALNSVKNTLDKYVLKTAVRDSITDNVNLTVKHDSLFLTHGNDIDTVPAGKMIHDSIVSRVHDGKLTLIKTAGDTTKLFTANQATNDTLDLSGYYDTTKVKKLVNDSIGNGKITIQKNGATITDGSFYLNQKTGQTINITVPTTVAELTDEANYAKVAANNQFTGTNTVPRGFVISGDNATNGGNCNNIVVNACDLWAVFDSLDRRMKSLENDLSALKSAFKPTTTSLSVTNRTKNSIRLQATASNPAFDISGYEFCCLNCGEGATPVCTTSTSNQYTFNGLTPYTDYNFTVKAMTFVDTVESSVVPGKTKAETPSAVPSVTALPIPQAGFSVDLSEIDLKGMPSGTIKVAYKLATASNYGNETTANIDALTSTYSKTVASLASNTQYNVRIVISNGDADTTFVKTVTTGDAITIAITRVFPGSGNLSSCKVSKNNYQTHVLLKATPSAGNSEDFTYSWSTSGGTEVETDDDSYYMVMYSLGSTTATTPYTVTCTATMKSTPNISLDPVTHSINFKKTNTSSNRITDFPGFSTNIVGNTVTLYSPSGSDLFTDWVSWQANSVPEAVGSSPSHTYDGFGTYTISAYSENGCRTDSIVMITPTFSIVRDVSGEVHVCQGTGQTTVRYEIVNDAGIDADHYEYVWELPESNKVVSVNPSGNVCDVTYSYGAQQAVLWVFDVVCKVKENNTIIREVNDNTWVRAGSSYCAPSFELCIQRNEVQMMSTSNVSTVNWGDGTTNNNTTHTYTSPGIYNIVAYNSSNVSTTKNNVPVGVTTSPCQVTSHNAQTDISGGGYNGADDGLETVNSSGEITSVTDYDGNIYPVVQIGSQCWLAENMRCTHSPSTGSPIVNPQNQTGNYASMSFDAKVAHWSPNNSSVDSRYGLLYNWCAAVDTFYANVVTDHKSYGGTYYNTVQEVYYETRLIGGFPCEITGTRRGICPKGWHIPSDDEWTTMLGSVNNAGELSGGCDWSGTTTNGKPNSYEDPSRNSKGFGALPAGEFNNTMKQSGSNAYFWSSTVSDCGSTGTAAENNKAQFAWTRYLTSNSESVSRTYTSRSIGQSVRCVRD